MIRGGASVVSDRYSKGAMFDPVTRRNTTGNHRIQLETDSTFDANGSVLCFPAVFKLITRNYGIP